jgi:hypothetical protein
MHYKRMQNAFFKLFTSHFELFIYCRCDFIGAKLIALSQRIRNYFRSKGKFTITKSLQIHFQLQLKALRNVVMYKILSQKLYFRNLILRRSLK